MGYSNIAGDLNVYGTTTLSSLRMNGSITAQGIISTGVSNFTNIIASNLTVTNAFIVTATNTQVTNALSITNQGTATALYVNQNETVAHVHNVAEFYDHTTVAMIIDPNGNVAIHQARSDGYALSVLQGASIDQLTLGTPLGISSGGTGTAVGATQNYVFAGPSIGSAGAPSFRALVNADLPSVISVSNVFGNGSGLSSLNSSNLVGNVANANVALVVSQATQPNITSVGTLTGLNVQGLLIASNGSSIGNINGTNVSTVGTAQSVTAAAQTNITSVGTLTGLNVQGLLIASNGSAIGNINGTNVSTVGTAQSVTAAAQTNITSVGTLTSLNVSGNIFSANAVTTTNLFANTLTLSNATSTINVIGSVTASTFYGAHAGSNTLSASNIFSANALTTTNLFANTLTLSNATSTINVIGTVTASTFYGALAGSNTISASNIFSANALTTTNLFANTLTLSNATSTINVTGNLYVSNAVTTTNIVAAGFTSNSSNTIFNYDTVTIPFINSTTLNVASTANVLVQTIQGSSGLPSLAVTGNIYASNALTTTNLFANTLTLSNATSIVNVTGNIYASNALTTTNLFANTLTLSNATSIVNVTGNIYASNAVQTTNVVASGTIYYNEDLFKRGPHLLPTVANASTIQAWISATCNAVAQPTKSWWASSATPAYGNIASGPIGTTDYGGSILLADNRVLFVPQNASNIGIFNPATNQFSTITPIGLSASTGQFRSGVLVPNGNVVFIPWNSSNVGVFNPAANTYANIAVGASAAGGGFRFQGGVLGPTGNVIMVPRDSANIGIFNPRTLTLTNVGPIAGQGLSLFGSGVLLPNGNVVMSPLSTGANIGMYNTYSLAATGFTNVGPIASSGTWESATLAPNGNVIFPPSSAINVVIYNPTFVSSPIAAGGFSNVSIGFGTIGGGNYFQGSALLPSGNVIFCPADASNVGMFDPAALTYSNCAAVSTATAKFYGATLVPDGRVVFTPATSANVGILNTFTPAPVEFCKSPYFNKY